MSSDPDTTYYEEIGGEPAVRRLVDAFYDEMESNPDAVDILEMHDDLDEARDKLFKFLSGWFGGPGLYVEEFGHPRLRRRHMPFSIGEAERDQWLMCMDVALEETIDDDAIRRQLSRTFAKMANHMRNR